MVQTKRHYKKNNKKNGGKRHVRKTKGKRRGGSFWTRMTTGCNNSDKIKCTYKQSRVVAQLCPSRLKTPDPNNNPKDYGYEGFNNYVECSDRKDYLVK